ncbi:60S ribosomal protein L38, partial [Striga asiatica]
MKEEKASDPDERDKGLVLFTCASKICFYLEKRQRQHSLEVLRSQVEAEKLLVSPSNEIRIAAATTQTEISARGADFEQSNETNHHYHASTFKLSKPKRSNLRKKDARSVIIKRSKDVVKLKEERCTFGDIKGEQRCCEVGGLISIELMHFLVRLFKIWKLKWII